MYEREECVACDLAALCAQLRSEILPLHAITGRYAGAKVIQRSCFYWDVGEVENETHFFAFFELQHR